MLDIWILAVGKYALFSFIADNWSSVPIAIGIGVLEHSYVFVVVLVIPTFQIFKLVLSFSTLDI